MKHSKETLLCLLGSFIFAGAATPGSGISADNPYTPIVSRNVFGLRPPPPPPAAPDLSAQIKANLPKLTLTGITTIFSTKRALIKAAPKPGVPGAKEEFYTLKEGERDGALEVRNIDEVKCVVTVVNDGTVQELTFEAPKPGTTGPGVPGVGVPTPVGGLPVFQGGLPHTLPMPMPSRPTRPTTAVPTPAPAEASTPPTSTTPPLSFAPTAPPPAPAEPVMSLEEQEYMIEAQRVMAKANDDPVHMILPPTHLGQALQDEQDAADAAAADAATAQPAPRPRLPVPGGRGCRSLSKEVDWWIGLKFEARKKSPSPNPLPMGEGETPEVRSRNTQYAPRFNASRFNASRFPLQRQLCPWYDLSMAPSVNPGSVRRRQLLKLVLLGVIILAGAWVAGQWTDGRYQGRSIRVWALQTRSTNALARAEAAAAFNAMGTKALPELLRLLDVPDARWHSQLWNHPDWIPLRWRVAVLKKAGPPDAHLTHEAAARSLGILGTQAQPAIPRLIAALGGGEEMFRWEAADALARIGGAASMQALTNALLDANPKTRQCAAYALGQMGPQAKQTLPALVRTVPDKAAGVMALYGVRQMGTSAIPATIELCLHSDETTRAAAALALGQIQAALRRESLFAMPPPNSDADDSPAPPNEIIKALAAALRDPATAVRVQAAQALALTGSDAAPALPALTECLKDASPQVQEAAKAALGRIGE